MIPDFTPRNRPTPSADAVSTGQKQKLLVDGINIWEFVATNSTLPFQSCITTAHLALHQILLYH